MLEEWDDLVANAVAGMGGVGVACIFAPGELLFGEPLNEVGFGVVEKGAEEGEVVERLNELHAGESTGTGAAGEAEEKGFELVVGVVGEGDGGIGAGAV